MKKILIISSQYGGGHRSAAEAIGRGFATWQPDCVVEHLDFGEIIGESIDKLFTKSYEFSIRYTPLMHRVLAALMDSDKILRGANKLVSPICKSKLRKHFAKIQPDIVVNTFPAANHTIEKLKKEYGFKFVTVVTDLLSVHHYWISPQTDRYLVAIPEMIPRLLSLGVAEEKIKITGFVVRPDFLLEKDPLKLKTKLGLDPKKFTVTYLLGSLPDEFALEMIQKINQLKDTQLIVICGKHEKYEKKIARLKLANIKIVGFTKRMDEYLRVCDVAIGKAGPGFIMEAATIGKPVILTSYIAPQEQGNVELVLTKKWGFFAPGVDLVLEKIEKIQKMNPAEYTEICRLAKETNPGNSARNIVDFIAKY